MNSFESNSISKQLKSADTISSKGLQVCEESLGSDYFKSSYGLALAYVSGSMYKGVASKELVVAMANGNLLSFYGAGGLPLSEVDSAIQFIKNKLDAGRSWGVNVIANLDDPSAEEALVDLLLSHQVSCIEASAFMQVVPSIVRYRLQGAYSDAQGNVCVPNRVLAKISHPLVAESFMSPASSAILAKLLENGKITPQEAELGKRISVASDLCVEADSGGHTDQGVLSILLPAMVRLRDQLMKKYSYQHSISVGAAGGIGTPESAVSAFMLGADFILTGSINQCSVEAGTSDAVKGLLQNMNVSDTAYAPSGDMFEIGSKIQVLKKGLFFPARANKLYELYQRFNAIEEIDDKTCQQIQKKFFKRSFSDVWQETEAYYQKSNPKLLAKAKANSKQKMALIFRWYFVHTARLAKNGDSTQTVDYQIHCGPALGAFNQWVLGTDLEEWKNRHVAKLARTLMRATAELLACRIAVFLTAAEN